MGLLRRIREVLAEPLGTPPPDAATQVALAATYRALAARGGPLPALSETGWRAFSQSDEDGKLHFIFALVGAGGRRAIEIAPGDGRECNTANLLVNHAWTALLVDADARAVRRGDRLFRAHAATRLHPPRFVHARVTRENVNRIVTEASFAGEVDLLSLDVDGVDYWIFEALEAARPRVVVAEYQEILGPERSCTVPYAPDFDAARYPRTRRMPNYSGCSLRALAKLADRKGYRLVGANALGFNAFFVRRGLAEDALPEVSVASCFAHPRCAEGARERFPLVKDLPWVEV